MRYTKDTQWLAPFVQAAGRYVPLKRLRAVKGYRVPLGKEEQCYANCTKTMGYYTITLRMECQRVNAQTHVPERVENVLNNLAHEMAHMKCWEHDEKFARLYYKLLGVFIAKWEEEIGEDWQAKYTRIARAGRKK